ncbi:MAG: hypothetical protein EOM80_07075 [Erysipelotrichia bacterium]|nr:hypothetical protein [Erysipelotrichia bacterium]
MNINIVEFIGYLGSVLVAISLSMKSVWKLRWINLAGSIFFAAYGYLIGAIPIFVVNSYISVMNVWYLVDYTRNRACFSLDSLENTGYGFFKKFYDFYEDDIREHFPEVSYEDLKISETSILFRNMIPVGIFSIRIIGEGRARVVMDYIVPEFRDFKFGAYIYQKKSYFFRDRQIARLEAVTEVAAHRRYLMKLGFKEQYEEESKSMLLVKKIV